MPACRGGDENLLQTASAW